ncbi:ATP-dependent Clp protease proteolytic subunit, partial [Staphylococcus condimenti]
FRSGEEAVKSGLIDQFLTPRQLAV